MKWAHQSLHQIDCLSKSPVNKTTTMDLLQCTSWYTRLVNQDEGRIYLCSLTVGSSLVVELLVLVSSQMYSLGTSPLPCGCWEYEVNGWPFMRGSEPSVVDRGSERKGTQLKLTQRVQECLQSVWYLKKCMDGNIHGHSNKTVEGFAWEQLIYRNELKSCDCKKL